MSTSHQHCIEIMLWGQGCRPLCGHRSISGFQRNVQWIWLAEHHHWHLLRSAARLSMLPSSLQRHVRQLLVAEQSLPDMLKAGHSEGTAPTLCVSPAGDGTCNGTDSTFFSLSKSTYMTGDGTVQGNGSFLVPSGTFVGSGESFGGPVNTDLKLFIAICHAALSTLIWSYSLAI